MQTYVRIHADIRKDTCNNACTRTYAIIETETYFWSVVSRKTHKVELVLPLHGVCCTPPLHSSKPNTSTTQMWSCCNFDTHLLPSCWPDTILSFVVCWWLRCAKSTYKHTWGYMENSWGYINHDTHLKKGRYECLVFTLGDNLFGYVEGFAGVYDDHCRVSPATILGFP